MPIPDRMQGHSLLPLLQGATPADWRTAFYYHYYEYPADHHVRPHYGVITDRYTLAHFYCARRAIYWELFDREKDPGEMHSVFGDPAYADVQTNLMQEVFRLRTRIEGAGQRRSQGVRQAAKKNPTTRRAGLKLPSGCP